jgi:hypothetical protein
MLPALAILGCLYFLPTLLAAVQRKTNAGAIFALNLFLGWTLIGWVIALSWSLMEGPPGLDRPLLGDEAMDGSAWQLVDGEYVRRPPPGQPPPAGGCHRPCRRSRRSRAASGA